jgi:autotransporter-associated beta strand protein
MKPRIISLSRFSFPLAAALAALLAVSSIFASTLYWDGTSSTANADGGNGNWNDNSNTNWDTLAVGGADSVWLNSNPDISVFGGTVGTVSLSSAITAGGITFNSTGYNLAGDGIQTLSFATGDNVILFNNIAAASTSGGDSAGLKLGGAGNVILSASIPATAGTLTLQYAVAGDHSIGWSGSTTINAGMTLALNGRDLSLSSTSGITLNGGGITLTNTNSTQGAFDRVSSNAITANGGTVTYTNTSGSGLIYGETIGAVDLNRGQTNFALTTNMAGGGGNIQTLTLSGLTRTGATNTSAINFSATDTGPNATTNIIKVTGATGAGPSNSTASVAIIGPWATSASSFWDYAVYDASGNVRGANISVTAENSGLWVAGNNVTVGGTTLTGNRTVNTLRYTGGNSTIALAGNTLATYGILGNGFGSPTISATTGSLTTPTGGNNTLYLTIGGNTTTVSAPINDNGSAVTVVKSGSGTLTLSSTASNFSGGTVLNAGTLAISANSHLGDVSGGITVNGVATLNMSSNPAAYNTARPITVNDGAVLTMNGGSGATSGKQFQGVLSGNGTLTISSNFNANFNNAGNTFTGTIVNQAGTLSFSSLGNSPNPIIVSGGNITWNGGAKTFGMFTLAAAGTFSFSNNGTGALLIPQPLGISGTAGARTLSLGGSFAASANVFAGDIADGNSGGASVVSLTRGGGGSTWALSGTNTYTGATTHTWTGTGPVTTFRGMQALSPNTSLNSTSTLGGGANAMGLFRFLDDSATPASRSTVNVNINAGENADPAPASNQNVMYLFVGNNSTANGGTSSSTNTGSTIQLGNVNFTQSNAGNLKGAYLTLTGANGYKLQVADVNVTLSGAYTGNWNAKLLADAPMTVTGTVRQANDAGVGSRTTLQLEGSAAGSLISGNILNSAGGRLINVSKAGTGTWTLGGTNSYTGTTGVSAGILRFTGDSSAANGAVSVTGGSLGGNGGSLGGAVTVSATGGIDLRDVSVGNLTLSGALNITGAAGANNLRFDMGNGTGTSDQLIVGGTTSVTTAGSAVIDLNWLGGTSGRTPGTYTLIGGAGTLDATNFAKFSLATTSALGQTYTLVHDLVSDGGTGNLQVTVANASGATAAAFWAGSTGVNWSSSTNWSDTLAGGGAVAGAPDFQTNVTFSTTTPVAANLTTNVLDVDFDINSLTFTNASGNVTIGGTKTLTLEAAAVNGNTLGNGINSLKTSGTNTISAKVGLAASQTWTVASGGTLAVSGAISDFGLARSLTKAGGGTLTLSGTNTYTGGTIINAGTVNITDHNQLGGSGRNITFGGSATLNGNAANDSTFGALAVNSGTATFGNASYAFTSTTGSGNITFNPKSEVELILS